MKKLLQSFLAVALISFTVQGFSQSTLWVGYRGWDGGSNNLYGYDTTSGSPVLATTLGLTSDFTGAVNGVHGMSLNPLTGVMYVNYQASGGTSSRRLGTVDLTTGDITDIGLLGDPDITDICFFGPALYGTGGQCGIKELYEIDITDGSTTSPGTMGSACADHCLLWNYYTDELLRFFVSTGNLTSVDVTDASESASIGSPAGWIHAMTMKNDSVIYHADGSIIEEFNLNTGITTPSGGSASGTIASMAFDAYPLYILIDGPTTFCSNDSSELSLSETGTAYQWMLDGTPIAGATAATHFPAASGTYTCDLDGSISLSIQIIVIPAPLATFTAAPIPVDLGVDGTGTITFTNTSSTGDGWHWDFDNGFETTIENPTFPFTSVGTYDVQFIVFDSATGCSDTAWSPVEVINSTGIGELNADFNVYPIPAEDIVTISAKEGHAAYTIDLISMSGQLISRDAMAANANNIQFDVSDVESGVYLVKIYNDLEEGYIRVVKK